MYKLYENHTQENQIKTQMASQQGVEVKHILNKMATARKQLILTVIVFCTSIIIMFVYV